MIDRKHCFDSWVVYKDFFINYVGINITLYALSLIGPINSLISPIIIGKLSAAIKELDKENMVKYIKWLAIINVAILILHNVDLYVSDRVNTAFSKHVRRYILECYFETHDGLSETAIDDSIAQNIRVYTFSINEITSVLRDNIIPNCLSLFGQAIYIGWVIDKWLGVIMGVICAAMVAMVGISMLVGSEESIKAAEADTDSFDKIDEIVDAYSTITATDGALGFELNRLNWLSDRKRTARRNSVITVVKYTAIVNVVVVGLLIAFAYRFYRVFIVPCERIAPTEAKRNENLENAIISVTMLFDAASVTRSVAYNVFDITDSASRLSTSKEHLSNCPKPPTKCCSESDCVETLPALSSTNIALEFNNVSFGYDVENDPTLVGITFAAKRGKITALRGKNGSGKSTILKLVMCFAKAWGGDIKIFGKSYSEMTPAEVRANISYANQNALLFDTTVIENIVYPQRPTIELRRDIIKLARRAGLLNFFMTMKNGFDTNTGRRGLSLSGGQRQVTQLMRIAYRALNNTTDKGSIVILDEITASVDVESKAIIAAAIKLLFKDFTVIIITHEEVLLSIADQMVDVEKFKFVKTQTAGP